MKLSFVAKLNRDQIFESQRCTHELWGDGLTLEHRLAKLQAFLANDKILSMCGLINEQGELLCSMKRYAFNLTNRQQNISAVGIGALFTNEKYRQRGIAQKLLEIVVDDAHASGCKAAVLFSDIDPLYYRKMGFVEAGDVVSMTIDIQQIPSSRIALNYRKAEKVDVEQLLAYHSSMFPPLLTRCMRGVDSWNFFRERYGLVEDYVVSCERKEIGFFSMSRQKNSIIFHEFFVPQEYELALLNIVQKIAQQLDVKQIEGWKLFQKLDSVSKTFHKRTTAIPMIRWFDSELGGNDVVWFDALDQF